MSSQQPPSDYPPFFLQVFVQTAESMGETIISWLDDGAVLKTADGKEHTAFFTNLYRRCQETDPDTWPDIIRHFLQAVYLTEEPPDNLDSVANQVLPRLGKPFAPQPNMPLPWSQPLGETGLEINLVIDYPDRMIYVTQEMMEKSSRSAEEWLQQARARLKGQTPAEWCTLVEEESGVRMACVGDSYDAARALIVHELLPDETTQGCFLAPIGRDRLFFLPVSVDSLPFVHLLKMLAEQTFDKNPYAISEEVFWVHPPHWLHFPITIREDKVSVFPPTEMLRALGWIDEE